jgi:mono/diheme cytochrome c family protein
MRKLSDIVPPFSQFGADCINCHASAAIESTFSALDNLIGPGLRFKGYDFAPGVCGDDVLDDDFLGREHAPQVKSLIDIESSADPYPSPFTKALTVPLAGFTDFFSQMTPVTFAEAWQQRLPAETYDHAVASADGPAKFITSDQCAPCHDATVSNAATPNMVFEHVEPDGSTTNVNLSPYGEWKASPMGLAGRDPIFFSQLQSETNNLPQLATCIETTCLHCHGVMGQFRKLRDRSNRSSRPSVTGSSARRDT